MNRRLPRIALFVVLLVSMLAVFQGGGVSLNVVAAQDQFIPCEDYPEEMSGHDFSVQPWGTPIVEDEQGIQFLSVFSTPNGADVPGAKTLFEIELAPEATMAIFSNSSTILRVEAGSVVQLTVCAGSTVQTQVQNQDDVEDIEGGGEPVIIGEAFPNEATAIYIEPGNFYYITGVSGARIGGTTGGSYMLCSKGSC